jgi:membrane fusion protein, multidrug efflux system
LISRFPITPLTAVLVTDNQHVAAGDVIARIDDRDYRIALAQAEAQVAAAQASIENIDAQIAVQQAQIAQNESQVQQQQASLIYAEQQSARYATLARDGWGTVQNAQQWSSQQRQGEASVKAAQDALVATSRQFAVLKAQRGSAEANLAQQIAQRDQAGAQPLLHGGQRRPAGARRAALGRSRSIRTALQGAHDVRAGRHLGHSELQGEPARHHAAGRPGEVTLHVDACPDRTVEGHVATVQPGSGTAFSLLPAQNATGNYVKIVQRVPVKIVLDNPPEDVALGPGMSVVPSVRVDPAPCGC